MKAITYLLGAAVAMAAAVVYMAHASEQAHTRSPWPTRGAT
jgi:hypothetical protein